MTKKKRGSGKTRTLNTEENRLLLLRLGKTHMNKVAAACGVSDDVIMRMRDRSGTFRLGTIEKVLNGLKGFEKKSVATQPSVPAINGAPRDFTRILADFEGSPIKASPVVEAVDHPEHYGGKDNPYEAIKVIEAWDLNFNLGNAAKYISRAGKKGCPREDLEKAIWYLKRELGRRSS